MHSTTDFFLLFLGGRQKKRQGSVDIDYSGRLGRPTRNLRNATLDRNNDTLLPTALNWLQQPGYQGFAVMRQGL